jgi:hypothetical protein
METDDLKRTIAETLEYILLNPAIFFSEADVQSIFYHRLMESTDLGLKNLYDTGCTIGLNKNNEHSQTKYKTTLMHREYGLNCYPKARVDLVILNPSDIGSIVDPVNLRAECFDNESSKMRLKYLEPDYIFEFGTDKSAGSDKSLDEHVENDLKKLNEAKKMGFLIHIQRNYLKGPDSEANITKHKKYAEIIRDKKPDKVKLLYFMVDVGGGRRGIYKKGKVKYAVEGLLSGINQNNLVPQILKLLE